MLEQEYNNGVRWGVAITVAMGIALTLVIALYSKYGHHLI